MDTRPFGLFCNRRQLLPLLGYRSADKGDIGDLDDFPGQGHVAAVSRHHALNHQSERQAVKTAQATAITAQQALSPVRPQNLEGVWGSAFFR
jgi:hypothetical protein